MESLNSAAWLASAREALAETDAPAVAAWGPRGAWQAGTHRLNHVLAGWFVGEDEAFAPMLAEASRLLAAPAAEGAPYGENSARWLALHRTAQALADWMAGEHADWTRAAAAWVAAGGADDQPIFADQARLVTAMADATPLAPADLAAFARRALATGPRVDVAVALALAFGPWATPPLSIAAIYALFPELALPPALVERGWNDADAVQLTLARDRFRAVDALLTTFGLTRDPDATPQSPIPQLATWTRQPTAATEADWQAEPGERALVSMRGQGAGRIAALLAEAYGGRIVEDSAAALTRLATISPRSLPRAGRHRWEMLRELVMAAAVDPPTLYPLVAAGLVDPDWRVRMTALYGLGRFRYADLARAAADTTTPPPDFAGFGADDRRTLLALRDAAVEAAAGQPPAPVTNDGAGPGGARRAAFVATIGMLFARPPLVPADRAQALIAALLGIAVDRPPRAWASWL